VPENMAADGDHSYLFTKERVLRDFGLYPVLRDSKSCQNNDLNVIVRIVER